MKNFDICQIPVMSSAQPILTSTEKIHLTIVMEAERPGFSPAQTQSIEEYVLSKYCWYFNFNGTTKHM